MSPTARALAELRKYGALAAVVERRLPISKYVTQDLFGFIDVLAIIGSNTVGIQVTSAANHAARIKKILAEPRAKVWLDAGNLIEVWSFAKQGPRGQAKKWVCRKEAVTLEDFR